MNIEQARADYHRALDALVAASVEHHRLTHVEAATLRLFLQGHTTTTAAPLLRRKPRTVKDQIRRIREALGVGSIREAIVAIAGEEVTS